MIEFTIPGTPKAKQRARVVFNKGRVFAHTPKETVLWENWIRFNAAKYAPKQLLNGALEVQVIFWLPRPKSLSKKIQYPIKRPDLDNLIKSCIDAMQGIIYTDDARIIRQFAFKIFGDPPRVDVKIGEINGIDCNPHF